MNPLVTDLYLPLVPRRTRAKARRDDEFLVVMPLDSLAVHLLNATGRELYDVIDGRLSVSDLVGKMAQRYPNVPRSTLTDDVTQALRDLEANGVVEFCEDTDTPRGGGTARPA